MKKYKHKSTGHIAERSSICQSYGIINSASKTYSIPTFVIEGSDDWEEVIEKDYEIISYLVNKKIFTENIVPLANKTYINIRSIKRLSDGEVFTVGDLIKRNDNTVKLETIELDDIWMGGIVINKNIRPNGGECLETLRKGKKPLFTTEDGIDIFEGDLSGIWVGVKSCQVNQTYSNQRLQAPYFTALNEMKTNKYYKRFSTKEAAEEYILMNKPCLSLNDIDQMFDNTSAYRYDQTEYLKNIVKIKTRL
ncbi:MAG: hypothetical protein ACJAVA_000209 [Flavobacteriaceae bacterium]|jgi:hypothetical protein